MADRERRHDSNGDRERVSFRPVRRIMDIAFERLSLTRRLMKRALIDPLSNYLPASWLRALLRFGKSELAASNWTDPGGWRSMVISYDGAP